MNLEDELSEILTKLSKKNISLQETKDLYFKAKEKFFATEEKERTETAGIKSLSIFFQVVIINQDFVKKWQSGKLIPQDKDLDLLEEGCKEVIIVVNYLKEVMPSVIKDDFKLKLERDTKELGQIIQQEKANRKTKNSATPTNQQENSAQEDSTQNTQQIQKLQKEIDSLTSQLTELQKQIGELLELLKKSQDSNNQSAKKEIEQKLAKVQNQQQQVQSQLESKKKKQSVNEVTNPIKENQTQSKETNSQTQNGDKFN
jgi:hypothetical protein